MIRSKSSIGKEKSYVVINNKEYNIKRDLNASEPPWFTAGQIYLTEDYFFAMIPSKTKEKDLVKISEVDIKDDSFSYTTDNGINKIFLNNTSQDNRIEKIRYYSRHSVDKTNYMELKFDPPLPNLISMKAGKKAVVGFSIGYNLSDTKEIYGHINITKSTDKTLILELNPEYPNWANKNRRILYKIDIESDKALIQGLIKR